MDDALTFTDLLEQAGTASAAQKHGKHIQRGHIRMA